MTKNELVIFSGFLDELEDYQGNAGCNDFFLPNTPANKRLIEKAIRYGFCKDEVDEQLEYLETEGARLGTMDSIVFDYLRHLAEKELGKK